MSKEYLIPVDGNYKDGDPTYINGWTIKEVINDWFRRYSLGSYHASREANSIHGSDKFIEATEMEIIG